MVGPQVVGHFSGVLEVDGVGVHADGEGADGLFQLPGGDGAHQTGVQTAGQEEAQRGVGVQTLFHRGHQLFPDGGGDGVQIVIGVVLHLPGKGVGHKPAVHPVVSRREGADLLHPAHQVFGLAGEGDVSALGIAVEEGPDADGVPGSDDLAGLGVADKAGKFCVQMAEHLHAVLPVEGQEDLTVAAAAEGVAQILQLFFHLAEAVQLAVAQRPAAVPGKGLHAVVGKTHNGQAVEAQQAEGGLHHPAVVRSPVLGTGQIALKLLFGHVLTQIT